jgi:hypothetical protein
MGFLGKRPRSASFAARTFPGAVSISGNGTSRAGIDSAAMADSLHEFESGGGSSGCQGRTGRHAIAEAHDHTGSANSGLKRQTAGTSRSRICPSDQ